jgi:hypothetical protein
MMMSSGEDADPTMRHFLLGQAMASLAIPRDRAPVQPTHPVPRHA